MIKNKKEEIRKLRKFLLNFYSSKEISEFCNVSYSCQISHLNGNKIMSPTTEEHLLRRLEELKKYTMKKCGGSNGR